MASLYTWNQLWELGEEMNLRMPNLAAGDPDAGDFDARGVGLNVGLEAELHQIRAVSRSEAVAARRDVARPGGIDGRHAHTVRQRKAGQRHEVFDAAVHAQGAAGQPA